MSVLLFRNQVNLLSFADFRFYSPRLSNVCAHFTVCTSVCVQSLIAHCLIKSKLAPFSFSSFIMWGSLYPSAVQVRVKASPLFLLWDEDSKETTIPDWGENNYWQCPISGEVGEVRRSENLRRKSDAPITRTRICASLGSRMKFKTLCYPVFGLWKT